MKKTTKIGLVFAILSAFVIIIGVVFALLIKQQKTMEENMAIIKSKYTEFSMNVVDNYHARDSLKKEFEEYTEESYPDKYKTFTEILTTYNETMVSLNKNVGILEDKCSLDYEDAETNIFCDNYQQLYEALNNVYIENMKKYNDTITEYNENNEADYKHFELINKEYIDFNKDGTYDGKTTE